MKRQIASLEKEFEWIKKIEKCASQQSYLETGHSWKNIILRSDEKLSKLLVDFYRGLEILYSGFDLNKTNMAKLSMKFLNAKGTEILECTAFETCLINKRSGDISGGLARKFMGVNYCYFLRALLDVFMNLTKRWKQYGWKNNQKKFSRSVF